MALTEAAIRQAKATDKIVCLYDQGGLYLEVVPAGGKRWRLNYRFNGKENRISLGVYPAVGLKEARAKRDEARKLLAEGVDPSAARQEKNAEAATVARIEAETFEVISREWFAKFSLNWSDSHAMRTMRRLELDAFPWIGARPVKEISASELLTTIRRVEARGALETAHRVLQVCGQVFRYAVATGRVERDPSCDLLLALLSRLA